MSWRQSWTLGDSDDSPSIFHALAAALTVAVVHSSTAWRLRLSAGAAVTAGKAGSRNADWSEDETILLLDLYLRHPDAEARHPEVAAFSELLRDLGRSSSQPQATNYRNPTGIAMKLRNLAQQDPVFQRSGRAGLGHGNRLNARVWTRLAQNPDALALEVERIRAGVLATGETPATAKASRGPQPSFGSFEMIRADGPAVLYVLILDGARQWVSHYSQMPPDHDIVKVELSNNVQRRVAELNAGLPAITKLRWRLHWCAELHSASDAYDVEQRVLRQVEERGWSGANEFAIAPVGEIVEMVRALT